MARKIETPANQPDVEIPGIIYRRSSKEFALFLGRIPRATRALRETCQNPNRMYDYLARFAATSCLIPNDGQSSTRPSSFTRVVLRPEEGSPQICEGVVCYARSTLVHIGGAEKRASILGLTGFRNVSTGEFPIGDPNTLVYIELGGIASTTVDFRPIKLDPETLVPDLV